MFLYTHYIVIATCNTTAEELKSLKTAVKQFQLDKLYVLWNHITFTFFCFLDYCFRFVTYHNVVKDEFSPWTPCNLPLILQLMFSNSRQKSKKICSYKLTLNKSKRFGKATSPTQVIVVIVFTFSRCFHSLCAPK